MIAMIEQLISNRKAYVSQGHVLFSVKTMQDYGKLSGRVQDQLESGARVKVEAYKHDPNDFVLWKPADADDDPSSVFDSPWGKGRPGWHIECSAMSTHYLGADFDIHGGGSDLMFPHHENEIAQSCGANPNSHFASYWVHNGFLTVNGEKMSKSLGNFITVRDLLDRNIDGEDIRLALLSTKYNEPLNWTGELLTQSIHTMDRWYRMAVPTEERVPEEFIEALCDDLNFPKAFSILHAAKPAEMYVMTKWLGLHEKTADQRFKGKVGIPEEAIIAYINLRNAAKKAKNWAEADKIRNELKSQGILLEDKPDGTTDWRRE
jgi:cysteinyl-tRNA synthetase